MEVGGSRSHSEISFLKSNPNPVLIFWSSIQWVFCVYGYTLLKVVLKLL